MKGQGRVNVVQAFLEIDDVGVGALLRIDNSG